MVLQRLIGWFLFTCATCAWGTVVNAASSSSAVPSNYRAVVAQRIWQSTDRRMIRRARISEPEIAAGLFGDSVVVCAEVIRQTPMFSEGRDHWVFTFKNGRIADARYSHSTCKRYFAFDELRG